MDRTAKCPERYGKPENCFRFPLLKTLLIAFKFYLAHEVIHRTGYLTRISKLHGCVNWSTCMTHIYIQLYTETVVVSSSTSSLKPLAGLFTSEKWEKRREEKIEEKYLPNARAAVKNCQ